MRSRLRAVSTGRTGRLLDLFEALEAGSGELLGPELLEAIARTARLETVLRTRYSSLAAPHLEIGSKPERARYLDVAAAAEYLGISRSTLRRLAERGDLPASRLSEGVVRFDVRDLDAYASGKKRG